MMYEREWELDFCLKGQKKEVVRNKEGKVIGSGFTKEYENLKTGNIEVTLKYYEFETKLFRYSLQDIYYDKDDERNVYLDIENKKNDDITSYILVSCCQFEKLIQFENEDKKLKIECDGSFTTFTFYSNEKEIVEYQYDYEGKPIKPIPLVSDLFFVNLEEEFVFLYPEIIIELED